MRILSSIFMVFLACQAIADDYEDNLVGLCDVKDSDLRAQFFVRNTDKHFQFKYIDANGDEFEDKSVKHRQNIFTEDYGIKLKRDKVKIRAKMSYYKAWFEYDTQKQTAFFKHRRSCIKDWWGEPCNIYVEKYRVDFENCNLDFTPYLDE